MPTRYLKPGIRDSELIDRLSPLAETLFYRLLVTVDDFGRTDARAPMIKAACFPIKDAATADLCADMLQELAEAGLIDLYAVDGKPYLQMRKWDNAPRAKESKFPPPADGCAHVHTPARKPRTVLPVTETETETGTENREPETETDNPPTPRKRVVKGEPEGFAEFWMAYPRKTAKAAALRAWLKVKPDEALRAAILSALAKQKASHDWQKDGGQFVPHPATWLNGARWDDEVKPAASHAAAQPNPADWRATRSGIEAKGIELGLGRWDEEAAQHGSGEQFYQYRQRVERAAHEAEAGPVDREGVAKLASIIGAAVKKVA